MKAEDITAYVRDNESNICQICVLKDGKEVFQNGLTASSGEATLLCFKGLENVRFFGCDTAGYCSTNTIKRLYDGAMIQLTIGCDVDRTGRKYCEDPIAPDVYTDDPIGDATEWILNEMRSME